MQAVGLHGAHALGIGKALAAAAMALQQDQRQYQGQHAQCNLRCRAQVGTGGPGGVDGHGERLHAQEFRGSDVVERLQQGQTHAHGNGRAGQGQGDFAKHLQAAGPQGACRFQQAGRLG